MGVRNWFKKSSKTFDREGFYIILFICLCIVAVTAVYISRNNSSTAKKSAEGQKVIDQQKEPQDKTDLVMGNTADLKSADENPKTVPAVNPPDKSSNTSSTTKTPATTKNDASAAQTFKITMPVEGKILKDFNKEELQYSKSLNQWETHEGIDILCDIGSEVKAAQAGKVIDIFSEDNAPAGSEKIVFGVTLVIEHNNGMRTIYSNLDTDSLKVKKGDSVKKGQVIGTVGDTTLKESASIEGSHLHFGMLKKSGKEYVTVNPNNYLK